MTYKKTTYKKMFIHEEEQIIDMKHYDYWGTSIDELCPYCNRSLINWYRTKDKINDVYVCYDCKEAYYQGNNEKYKPIFFTWQENPYITEIIVPCIETNHK